MLKSIKEVIHVKMFLCCNSNARYSLCIILCVLSSTETAALRREFQAAAETRRTRSCARAVKVITKHHQRQLSCNSNPSSASSNSSSSSRDSNNSGSSCGSGSSIPSLCSNSLEDFSGVGHQKSFKIEKELVPKYFEELEVPPLPPIPNLPSPHLTTFQRSMFSSNPAAKRYFVCPGWESERLTIKRMIKQGRQEDLMYSWM